jgi:hypothetical protein
MMEYQAVLPGLEGTGGLKHTVNPNCSKCTRSYDFLVAWISEPFELCE